MSWKKWFKNPWFIGLIIILGTIAIFYSYGLWLLSDASPYIYNELYPANTSQDTIIVQNLPIQINDTLYVGKQRIVSHKEVVLQQTHVERIEQDSKPTAEQLGVLGDSAGLWNALFYGLALIGVIITIIYQTYRDGKNEKSNRITRFRDEFYRLLDCISKVVIEIEIRITSDTADTNEWEQMLRNTAYGNSQQTEQSTHSSNEQKTIKGRACFKYIYLEQPNSIADAGNRPEGADYETLESHFADYFSHYFRLLYRLLRYIDNAEDIKDLSEKDKIKDECFGILKAHLSTFELLVIFYNGLLEKNFKAKPLYEKAKIFDNLNVEYLTFPKEKQYYKSIKKAKTIDDIPTEDVPSRYYEPQAFVKINKRDFKFLKWIKNKWGSLAEYVKSIFQKKQPEVRWDEKVFMDQIRADEELTQNKLLKRLPFKECVLNDLIERLINEGKLSKIQVGNKTCYKRI